MDIEMLKWLMRQPHLKLISPRAVYGPLTFTRSALPEVDLEALGYLPRAKTAQLTRNYFNAEAAEQFRKKVKNRRGKSFTSLTYRPHGAQKRGDSMGYCINAIVLTEFNSQQTVTIQYRTTEILQKFHADLTFFPWLFEQLDVAPQQVTFQLANAFLSGCFLPALFTHWKPADFYSWTSRNADPGLHFFFCRYYWKRYGDPEIDLKYSPARRQHALAWRHPDITRSALDWIQQNCNLEDFF